MIGLRLLRKSAHGVSDALGQRILGGHLVHYYSGDALQFSQYIVGQFLNLNPMGLNQLNQRRIVSRGIFIEHILVGGTSCRLNNSLKVSGQRVQSLLINN